MSNQILTNGLIQSGKKYDEYADKIEYYFGFQTRFLLQKLNYKSQLKKRSQINEEKVKQFFTAHAEDTMNELKLGQLILYLNQ